MVVSKAGRKSESRRDDIADISAKFCSCFECKVHDIIDIIELLDDNA